MGGVGDGEEGEGVGEKVAVGARVNGPWWGCCNLPVAMVGLEVGTERGDG